MLKAIFSKVMWIGRATVFTVGLAVLLAVTAGVATTALAAAPGDPLRLGKGNTINKITKLVGSVNSALLRIDNNGGGAALDLQVEPGNAPMTVNSDTQVANLNAAEVDGKSANQIGVNGLERVVSQTGASSISPKNVTARCSAGKVLVGSGYFLNGGKSGNGPTDPNQETDVVLDEMNPAFSSVYVEAFEEEATSASWNLGAVAICATAP